MLSYDKIAALSVGSQDQLDGMAVWVGMDNQNFQFANHKKIEMLLYTSLQYVPVLVYVGDVQRGLFL